MKQTARGIILNFLDIIDQYGFMPNGGRIYYLNRSQPPVLTLMVYKYFMDTQDTTLLARALPVRSHHPSVCSTVSAVCGANQSLLLLLLGWIDRRWTRSINGGCNTDP
jgi:hypothetical protein